MDMPQKVIIIGATSGIGLAAARLLRSEGAKLGVAGRRVDRLAAFAAEEGAAVAYKALDVTEPSAPKKMEELAEELGGVDLIMLVAGIGSQNMGLNPEIELQTAVTNVVGFTRMIDAAFAYFKARGGGHIAIVSSIAGTKGLGAAPAYSATKRYQNTYVQCLAQLSTMTAGRSVTFTDIRPGFVDTALLKGGKYPLLMKPENVARIAVRAIRKKKRVVVIDWRYRLLVWGWKLIPDFLWERLTIKTKG